MMASPESEGMTQAALDVGKCLREARERNGLSVLDVAGRVKFAPRQVEALEANDYDHLPQATFLRGFVRSYARMLGIDEEPLLEALPVQAEVQQSGRMPVPEFALPSLKSLSRPTMLWLGGAAGVAVLLLLFLLLRGSRSHASRDEIEPVPLPQAAIGVSLMAVSQPASTTGDLTVTRSAVVAAVPVASGVTQTESSNTSVRAALVSRTPSPAKTSERKPTPAPIVEAKKPAQAESVAPASGKPDPSLDSLKRRPVHFVFTGSAWTEVIDVHGVVLLSRSNDAGTEKWVGGPRREPYEITLRNPSNVKLYFHGKQVDLSSYAGMESAHLRLE